MGFKAREGGAERGERKHGVDAGRGRLRHLGAGSGQERGDAADPSGLQGGPTEPRAYYIHAEPSAFCIGFATADSEPAKDFRSRRASP